MGIKDGKLKRKPTKMHLFICGGLIVKIICFYCPKRGKWCCRCCMHPKMAKMANLMRFMSSSCCSMLGLVLFISDVFFFSPFFYLYFSGNQRLDCLKLEFDIYFHAGPPRPATYSIKQNAIVVNTKPTWRPISFTSLALSFFIRPHILSLSWPKVMERQIVMAKRWKRYKWQRLSPNKRYQSCWPKTRGAGLSTWLSATK